MLQKPFMAWYIPMREQSPKLKYMVFSEELLLLIGYKMEEVPLMVQDYRELCLE